MTEGEDIGKSQDDSKASGGNDPKESVDTSPISDSQDSVSKAENVSKPISAEDSPDSRPERDHGKYVSKDGTWIEYTGTPGEDYHVHYDSSGGSDVPVAVHDHGPTQNIRDVPIGEIGIKRDDLVDEAIPLSKSEIPSEDDLVDEAIPLSKSEIPSEDDLVDEAIPLSKSEIPSEDDLVDEAIPLSKSEIPSEDDLVDEAIPLSKSEIPSEDDLVDEAIPLSKSEIPSEDELPDENNDLYNEASRVSEKNSEKGSGINRLKIT